jgi:hypothetical protein
MPAIQKGVRYRLSMVRQFRAYLTSVELNRELF